MHAGMLALGAIWAAAVKQAPVGGAGVVAHSMPVACRRLTARVQRTLLRDQEWRMRGQGWHSGGAWHYCSH
eukprot:5125620-Prymnesium_polylepis.1